MIIKKETYESIMKVQNDTIRKSLLKNIKNLIEKIEKTENKIRKLKPHANFDRRYSKSGQLSNSCCKFDDLKIALIDLNKELNKLESQYEKICEN